MHILVHNSSSKDNQTVKFGQLIQHNVKNIFKNRAENKVAELVPYPFFSMFYLFVFVVFFCFFFSKIWFRQSLDIMDSYHHVQYQIKIMIQPWENLVTDGRTDRQTRVISQTRVMRQLSQ